MNPEKLTRLMALPLTARQEAVSENRQQQFLAGQVAGLGHALEVYNDALDETDDEPTAIVLNARRCEILTLMSDVEDIQWD